jgi:hypothetical protein
MCFDETFVYPKWKENIDSALSTNYGNLFKLQINVDADRILVAIVARSYSNSAKCW